MGPYERSPERTDYANGYKPKTVRTRMGKITFDVPQVREGDFYPSALEKGLCSERALTITLAEIKRRRSICKDRLKMSELKLDAEEKELLTSYEADEWQSVDAVEQEVKVYSEYATATFK